MELAGRADPRSARRSPRCSRDCDVVVDFTTPDTALENALACVRAGVHVVIGTTGFDLEPSSRASRERAAKRERARRAELRDRRGADDALRRRGGAGTWRKAEIIELHHDGKLDAPSGTAARTAQLMAEASGGAARRRSTRCACPGSSPTRR